MIRLIQGLFSSMSLERKCLLFFGSALMVLMFGAFLVVEMLGQKLVKNTTRTRARDFYANEVLRLHNDAIWSADLASDLVRSKREVLTGLRGILFDEEYEKLESNIDFEIMALKDPVQYVNLPAIALPHSEEEIARLDDLEAKFRNRLAQRIAVDRPDVSTPLDLAEDKPMNQIGSSLISMTEPVFDEVGPVDGRFVYYTPIFFTHDCMSCHSLPGTFSLDNDEDPVKLAQQYPFRVMKVTMPYELTNQLTTMIRAIVVSLCMLIIAVTLFVLHAIVRHLVLYPMYHLRDVSDAITHGDTNQRAVIETEDEFRELADAFNRMLRHLTETQDQIQEVNKELDARVDQLAQLNLQLYEANRLKSDFLANMSHELRTPLNSIIGFSEVLQGIDSLNDKQRRYASNIQKSGRLLLEMINDILDLAKVEAGKMEVKRSDFDLARLVSAQCDMIHSLSEDKNISLSVQVPGGLPQAHQDPNKLGQIINNLLSNAIKFTPEGGMITVSVTNLDRGRFRLEVTDTGVGIAEEDQPIIFEKFRQSRKVLDGEGLTREYSGTGLGLSIVKELAKLLGGEVDFQSELGRGSSFWVTLPWQLSDLRTIEISTPAETVSA
ncbi:Signal transduction histidine-protein kinase BarA [Rubripirellula lacrimiformis]|uniref:histidine kinase n=1 Tax=Rubripirellula lacrimiformis TaxID=1930273 RepID=A0A517N3T7_9BACT|nr:ATP-binding protein [Rubripirellula lacrimiformis]QDT01805.1 Signal transduction histidine-protein kinase BarA [Rubripirellula lacrimiformis]